MKNFFKINRALVAKKKFFTLTLALMATMTMWAETFYILSAKSNVPLTAGMNNAKTQLLKLDGSTLSATTDISSSLTGTGSLYYNSTSASYAEFIKTSNYGTSSTANRTMQCIKVAKTTTMTITLNDVVCSKIDVIYHCASTDNCKLTVAGVELATSDQNMHLYSAEGTYSNQITITGDKNKEYQVCVILTVAPAVTHALEWDFDGGSCSATPGTDYTAAGQVAEGATITYPANNTMTKDGYDFNGWSTSETTMPTNDLTIIAQWAVHQTSSDATLSALSVAGCTLSPAFAPATTAYTIALPFYASMPAVGAVTATKNDSYAKTPAVSISDNVITIACEAENGTKLNYTITVNIADAPTASSSINIEQNVLDNTKKWGIESALTAANIVTDGRNGLDSLDESKTLRNYPFLGLKLKKNNADILKVIVPAGSVLNIKMGSIGGALNVIVNGEAHSTIAADKNKKDHFFHLDAVAYVREVIFHTTTNETTTLQQVKIGTECDPITLPALYTVTYNAGAGTCEKATDFVEFADDQITLPEATPAIGYSFDGWYNAATEGTKVGDAGAKITLSKDSTLYAQYNIIDYAITCDPAENGSVSADKATANYGEEVTLTVTPAGGYKIASVKYNDGEDHVIEAVAGVYSFTMPAAAVTVSATFSVATALDNTDASVNAVKFFKDGQLFIEKNGHVYNVFGACIK